MKLTAAHAAVLADGQYELSFRGDATPENLARLQTLSKLVSDWIVADIAGRQALQQEDEG